MEDEFYNWINEARFAGEFSDEELEKLLKCRRSRRELWDEFIDSMLMDSDEFVEEQLLRAKRRWSKQGQEIEQKFKDEIAQIREVRCQEE